jgi:hypothetical protein
MTWPLWLSGLALAAGIWLAYRWDMRHPPRGAAWGDDYGDAVGVLEVWLEQPVREACTLDVREEVAWKRITEGAK